jgi:hypothetical protein
MGTYIHKALNRQKQPSLLAIEKPKAGIGNGPHGPNLLLIPS